MVDSPSKKQKPARYKLPSSGNLFLVRVVIYDKLERIQLAHYSDNNRSFEFESVWKVGAWITVRVEYGEEANMRDWKSGGAVHRPVSQNFILIDITKASLN